MSASGVGAADRVALARRLLSEVGVHAEALMIARPELERAIGRAVVHGGRLFAADRVHARHCRLCGCTSLTACRPDPCHWVAPDLCSACQPFVDQPFVDRARPDQGPRR